MFHSVYALVFHFLCFILFLSLFMPLPSLIDFYLNLSVPSTPVDISTIKFIHNTHYSFSLSESVSGEFEITADDFVFTDNKMMVIRGNQIEIYSIKRNSRNRDTSSNNRDTSYNNRNTSSNNRDTSYNNRNTSSSSITMKLIKSLNISSLFYYHFRSASIRRFFMRIMLKLMHIPRYDCYLEAIMEYLRAEEIEEIKEYSNGISITHTNNTRDIRDISISTRDTSVSSVSYYDEFLNLTNSSVNFSPMPNNLIQHDFMLKMHKDSILIFREDTGFINKKKIQTKRYGIYEGVIYMIGTEGRIRFISYA